jgi:hypothetical protein
MSHQLLCASCPRLYLVPVLILHKIYGATRIPCQATKSLFSQADQRSTRFNLKQAPHIFDLPSDLYMSPIAMVRYSLEILHLLSDIPGLTNPQIHHHPLPERGFLPRPG